MKVITAGIATPSKEDIELMMKLHRFLSDVFDDCILPDPSGENNFCTEFDDRRTEHVMEFYRKIKEIYNGIPSAFLRAAFSLAAIYENGFIDKDAPVLTMKFDDRKQEVRI